MFGFKFGRRPTLALLVGFVVVLGMLQLILIRTPVPISNDIPHHDHLHDHNHENVEPIDDGDHADAARLRFQKEQDNLKYDPADQEPAKFVAEFEDDGHGRAVEVGGLWLEPGAPEPVAPSSENLQSNSKVVLMGEYMANPDRLHRDTESCLNLEHIVDLKWTSYVVIQVDNRIVMRDVPSNQWNSTERELIPRAAWLYNTHMAKAWGYLYRLFVPPKECRLLDGRVAAGYWCKVPYLAMVSRIYPNAKGIIFLDSDAYLSSTLDVYMQNNGLAHDYDGDGGGDGSNMLSQQSPLYLHQDNGFWNRTMTSYFLPVAYPFDAAVNTGTMFFHPKSTKAREALEMWWFDSPYIRSEIELRGTCLHVELHFSDDCSHYNWASANTSNTTAEAMHAVFLHQLKQTLPADVAQTFDYNTPASHFTRCGELHFPCTPQTWWCKEHYPCWNEYEGQSSLRYNTHTKTLLFVVREIANTDVLATVKRMVESGSQELVQGLGRVFGCTATSIELKNQFTQSFTEVWPGEQERMEMVIKKKPNNIQILAHMQDLWSDYDVPTEADHASDEPYQASRCPKGCLVLHPSPRDLGQRSAGRVIQFILKSNLTGEKASLGEKGLQEEFKTVPVIAGHYKCMARSHTL